MPRKYQQGYIFSFPGKSKGKKKTTYVVLMKKTGFQDVWIGNKHYYYDEEKQYNSIDEVDMKDAFDTDRRTTTKKGKIVIKRKGK